MLARIAYSSSFVRRRFLRQRQAQGLRSLLLTRSTLAAFACAAMVCTASNAVLLGGAGQLSSECRPWLGSFLRGAAMHVALGGLCLAWCAVMVVRTERDLAGALQAARKHRSE